MYRIDDSIYQFKFPFIESNMYLMLDCSKKEALVVDPHRNEEAEQLLKEAGIKNVLIVLTHEHFDHTSGIPWLREHFHCQICCHQNALDSTSQKRNNRPVLACMLNDKFDDQKTLKEYFRIFEPYTYEADWICRGEIVLTWNSHKIFMQYAPGHSPASVLIELDQKYIFTGDSLIPGIQVITRFPGGNQRMYETITFPMLKAIEKNKVIMPGHGEPIEYCKLICENFTFTVISEEE